MSAIAPTCRRFYIDFVLCMYLVVACTSSVDSLPRTGSYRGSSARQPGRSGPAVPQYYRSSGLGNLIRPSGMAHAGRLGGAWNYGPVLASQRAGHPAGKPTTAEDVTNGFSNPNIVGEWASRSSVRKSEKEAYQAAAYGSTVLNNLDRVVESAGVSFGGFDRGQAGESNRVGELQPPSHPPPSMPVLPSIFAPQDRNETTSVTAAGERSVPRPGESAQTSASETAGHTERISGQGDQVSPNPVDIQGQLESTSHGMALPTTRRKRVVETADLSLGGYTRLRPSISGNGKQHRSNDRRQVFEPMPPFRPPPSGSILPDLFSPKALNGSTGIIGMRPTRPSSSGANSDGTPMGGRGQHPPSDQGIPADYRGLQPSPRQEPRLNDQQPGQPGSQMTYQESRYGPDSGQTETTDGDTAAEPQGRPLRPPALPPPSLLPKPPFTSFPAIPPIEYQDLPIPGSTENAKMPEVKQGPLNLHDVLVTIEARRLRLTYSVNVPPYFTFENLLSQLATYLMPGFCVDLAVTRRDERCEMISHMAALKTDRMQNWQIEISDVRGKIIWLNQCIPDARLFIVPGLRVSFKYGSHVPTPEAVPKSAEASPGDSSPAAGRETAQPPVDLPVGPPPNGQHSDGLQ